MDCEKLIDKHFQIFKHLISIDNRLYAIDLFTYGAVNRSISNTSGFFKMLKFKNLQCSATILRLQLDTLISYYALSLVKDPDDFAFKISTGKKRIDDYKDKSNKKLSNTYLCKRISEELNSMSKQNYNWINNVYDECSRYIHFSNKHILSNLRAENTDSKEFNLSLEIEDGLQTQTLYSEAKECFEEITELLFYYINGWLETKTLTSPHNG